MTESESDHEADAIMRAIARKNRKQKKARLVKIKRPGEDLDPSLAVQQQTLKIDNLGPDEKVVPDFKRMKKGVHLLYDFIEQKVEDEILENRYDTYK